jgi:hypothetical protein
MLISDVIKINKQTITKELSPGPGDREAIENPVKLINIHRSL